MPPTSTSTPKARSEFADVAVTSPSTSKTRSEFAVTADTQDTQRPVGAPSNKNTILVADATSRTYKQYCSPRIVLSVYLTEVRCFKPFLYLYPLVYVVCCAIPPDH